MTTNNDYKQWLIDLKKRIRQSQIKAAIKVNTELLRLYWDLGQDIVIWQMEAAWGSKILKQLSKDLITEFPDMKGFSHTNLKYCKRFYQFYNQSNAIVPQIGQQLADQLQVAENKASTINPQVVDQFEHNSIFQIPWFHHVQIITKCKSTKEALFYIQKTIENGWSRAVLMNFLETDLYNRQGKSLNNFNCLLPEVQSDLASEIIKDPYNFDFLTLTFFITLCCKMDINF
jgi:predicted nuclease of restriction endonuclease-like (RecB) superfamily